ncbi:15275_t:CDS:2, partial [Funneliformis mosseae]
MLKKGETICQLDCLMMIQEVVARKKKRSKRDKLPLRFPQINFKNSIYGNRECASAQAHVGRKKVATSTFEKLADVIIGLLIVGFHEAMNSFLRSFERGKLVTKPYRGKGEVNLNS